MANITPYTDQIANAVYGEEVRSSIINALVKVNDDNESYAQLKADVIAAKDAVDDQVEAFDGKVEAAEQVTSDLEAATSAGNTAKSNLVSATDTANTAKTNLQSATTTANTARTNLNSATSTANTAKSNLETATAAANTAKTNAETAKTNLDASITAAGTAKTQLDNSVSTAGTSKSNLDSAVSTANSTKTQLQSVIDTADQMRTDLAADVQTANTARTNLESSTGTAQAVYQSLQAENSSASSNLEELRSENFNAQEILAGVANIEAYLGITTDVLGLSVDYENKTYTRLAGAVGKTAGADFDQYTMYGGRRLCNVADDGTIVAWYGDNDYAEDGSMGQVMVYQPKFYYLVAPVNYDPIDTGIGYHLRKANYYVSQKARTGFRLHPAFYDANGEEIDYFLTGAYEGCLYDVSENAYITDDAQVMAVAQDKFSSIAGVKPASGHTQGLTRPNVETLAQNRGSGFHGDLIKLVSAEQLLMMIELGTMNFQDAISAGVTGISDSPNTTNNSSLTGSTASIGNGTGRAASTINERNGTTYTETAANKTAMRWRGKENFFGNIWKFVYGVNMWGNGSMGGGQPYICNDFSFAESKNNGNYEPAGFTVTNANGYISAIGYSTKCDWLFMASECTGNSSLPVGDYHYVTPDLNAYRIAQLGGYWLHGAVAGGFCWTLNAGVGNRHRSIGGRLVYVPTRNAEDYQTNINAWEEQLAA